MSDIFTIGHSTRTHDEVFEMLEANNIEILMDVRSYPSSRHCPQWNKSNIMEAMPGTIEYLHIDSLGGKRKPLPINESVNGAWRNASFRGYADYIQTDEFENGLSGLLNLAASSRVAIMCAEAVWWKCHRSIVSDVLVARNIPVHHIMSKTNLDVHKLRDFAVVESGRVWYPKVDKTK